MLRWATWCQVNTHTNLSCCLLLYTYNERNSYAFVCIRGALEAIKSRPSIGLKETGSRYCMPAHPFGVGDLDEATQMRYLNHLVAMHTDIQSQAEGCAHYAKLIGVRASVMKHFKKNNSMTEQEVLNVIAMYTDDKDGYDAAISVGIGATEIAKDAILQQMVMTQLGLVNWKACYVKLRCALCDYDEWNIVKMYFDALAVAEIKDCKVLKLITNS